MQPPNRPCEINFYQELGVAADASPEEIRDAFRSLARLLHPDQQTDDQLKKMAEAQMRKLNPIYAVLSDPERRRRYDEDLADGYQAPIIFDGAPPRNFHRVVGRMVWAGAILLTGGLLFWLASDTPPSPQSRGRIENLLDPSPALKPSSNASESADLVRLRADLRAVLAERDAALHELSVMRGKGTAPAANLSFAPRPVDRSTPMIAMTELPSTPRVSAAPPATAKPESPTLEPSKFEPPKPSRRLAGFWFYAQPPQGQKNKNQSLYPPEYIEAVITEENGVVHGNYRSRFRIVDRAISPEVNFSFAGTPNGLSVSCPWSGPGGAHGELTMRLVSDNSIKIDWNATELGTQQGLISGTAVLTRRLE